MKPVAVALCLMAAPIGAQEWDGWALLAGATLAEEGSAVAKTFPPALIAAAEQFEISGYVVPLVAEPYLKTFLLVPDPADCPFCGGGGYGPSLEVEMKRALPDVPEGTYVVLNGRLELDRSPETYDLFRLIDAETATDVAD